ncbi:hypothetical protein ANO11243_091290 [Dothideomycetidae sp. 11243]|nr:hypothetical protein ANO11243_091290 [fungal sp. No.11243]
MASFSLSRATVDDLAGIIDVMFKTLRKPLWQETCMGSDTPEGHRDLAESIERGMQRDPGECWIKIAEATGRIIAATEYRMYPDRLPDHMKDEDCSTLCLQHNRNKTQLMEQVENRIRGRRHKYLTQPYIRRVLAHDPCIAVLILTGTIELNYVFTDPDFQHRGGKYNYECSST